jgi:hypothetical protein
MMASPFSSSLSSSSEVLIPVIVGLSFARVASLTPARSKGGQIQLIGLRANLVPEEIQWEISHKRVLST